MIRKISPDKIIDQIFIIGINDECSSLKFNIMQDRFYWSTVEEISLSFLKGLQKFVSDMEPTNYYKLILKNKIIFGSIIHYNSQVYCYLVVDFKNDKQIPDKRDLKRKSKIFQKIHNCFESRIQLGDLNLRTKSINLNLKRAIHNTIY